MYNDNRLLANETIVTDVLMFSSFLEDTRIPNEYPCVLAKLGKKLMIFFLYVYIGWYRNEITFPSVVKLRRTLFHFSSIFYFFFFFVFCSSQTYLFALCLLAFWISFISVRPFPFPFVLSRNICYTTYFFLLFSFYYACS